MQAMNFKQSEPCKTEQHGFVEGCGHGGDVSNVKLKEVVQAPARLD